MFSGWFQDPRTASGSGTQSNAIRKDHDDEQIQGDSGNATRPVLNRRMSSPPSSRHATQPSSSQNLEPLRRVASHLSPHDALVVEIDGKLKDLELTQRLPSSKSSLGGEADKNEKRDYDTSAQQREASASVRARVPENIYDPLSGQSIGLLAPGDFNQVETEIWDHLARIRELQSEIATMHSQMEGLGTRDQLHTAEPSVDDDGTNAEDGRKGAEFVKLSDRFAGRKDAIDAIMSKLDQLSNVINDFHSSRAPLFVGSARSSLPTSSNVSPPAPPSANPGTEQHLSRERDVNVNILPETTGNTLLQDHPVHDSPAHITYDLPPPSS